MIHGTIIHGDGVGKSLGYPTANLDPKKADIHLSPGVYAATATYEEKKYCAALVIMDSPKKKVEVHLIGYDGPDIYGKELSLSPIQQVSAIESYSSVAELKKKIDDDIRMVKHVCRDRM